MTVLLVVMWCMVADLDACDDAEIRAPTCQAARSAADAWTPRGWRIVAMDCREAGA